jgi:hypothetical protein
VDQSHSLWHIGERPEGCHHRPRKCLLKGCERLFWPRHWRSHFCSKACQQEAQRWRRWKASQQYRATDHGKERRREQSRRRRQRQRARQAASADADAPCEGQRLQPSGEDFSGEPCHRPGCYELFSLPHEHSCKRFCASRADWLCVAFAAPDSALRDRPFPRNKAACGCSICTATSFTSPGVFR